MELLIAESSGQSITAPEDGEIVEADANTVVLWKIRKEKLFPSPLLDVQINPRAFNMRVQVLPGQKVEMGDVIADGASVDKGEVSIGRNLLVAYMSWNGFNFEDAIILSERVARKDFTILFILMTFPLMFEKKTRSRDDYERYSKCCRK